MADAAMSVTNSDGYERTLRVIEGSDGQVIYDLSIGPRQTINGLCREGCTVVLENGIQQSFRGYEEVQIYRGRFTWSP